MNKQIRLLIEEFGDLFNDGLLNTDDVYTTISNELFYKYHPKTKEELKTLIEELLKERGEDADLNDIDVSNITDMSGLFGDLVPHNINISQWDVSSVKNMNNMFEYCYFFNCDLFNWDVSNVTNMLGMFKYCNNFDGNLSDWNVSNVEDMWGMFYYCRNFTGKGLNSWKPIKCKDMNCMFCVCKNFNCDLSGWDVSNVEKMGGMFSGCTDFTGKGLNSWKPIKCKYMDNMFDECCSLKSYPNWYKE